MVEIRSDKFYLNGHPTYRGRAFNGHPVEGLLLNSRMVQGIFDDRNPATRSRWAYPDAHRWDPDRNTTEFVAAMPEWQKRGLLAFTLNLQGGSPEGYSQDQPWINSAFERDGRLRPDYMDRLARILDRADELGMVAIVGYFYFGQDQVLDDETAVRDGVKNATEWLFTRGYRNVLIEVNNECDVPRYDHDILKAGRIHELIDAVKAIRYEGRRFVVSTSFGGGKLPTENVVRSVDFILMHGNGVSDPNRIAEMVNQVRATPGYRSMPVLFNEDDHFDFDKPVNNMVRAVESYVSWGYFDPGENDYRHGYQCPPVNWDINTDRKRAFFELVSRMASGSLG